MQRIAPSLLTVYADLVQSLAAGEDSTVSVYAQTQKGKRYLYAVRREGADRKSTYIGPEDDAEAAARAAEITASTARAKARRTAISALRSARIPVLEPELGRVLEVVEAGGLFRNGAVLVGTGAFQCYSPMVGHILPAAGMGTRDVDLATASLALSAGRRQREARARDRIADESGETESLELLLKRADPTFTGLPTLDRKAFPSRFRNADGFLVEMLVPIRSRNDTNPMPIPALKAGAIPLQHLGWLIENPVPAAALYGTGIFVRVPQPARYAVHKLLIAQKRIGDVSKKTKDLLQAKALIEALVALDPAALFDALDDARGRGVNGWEKPVNVSLAALGLSPETLEPAGA